MKKRWLVMIEESNKEWIKEAAEESEIKGSDIINEAIERAKEDPSFKKGLIQAQLKVKLQEINDRRSALEEEARELKKALGEQRTREGVAA